MKARSAYAIDAESGQVLYERMLEDLPGRLGYQILTLAVIEQDIRAHKLSWDQKITASPAVAQMANDPRCSNVQLNAGEKYTVKQLVESMMLVSADGSTEALALADAGSTAAFNKKMQAVAHKAGVDDAEFITWLACRTATWVRTPSKGSTRTRKTSFQLRTSPDFQVPD